MTSELEFGADLSSRALKLGVRYDLRRQASPEGLGTMGSDIACPGRHADLVVNITLLDDFGLGIGLGFEQLSIHLFLPSSILLTVSSSASS